MWVCSFVFPPTLTCSTMVIRLKESKMSRLVTKPTKWHVRQAKTQISLGISPVWSESSPCAQRVAKDPSFLHADSEDSDRTGRMARLIWVFAGRTLLVLWWGSPNHGTKTLFTFLRLITCIFFSFTTVWKRICSYSAVFCIAERISKSFSQHNSDNGLCWLWEV